MPSSIPNPQVQVPAPPPAVAPPKLVDTASTQGDPSLPKIVFGEWFPLFTSPDQLVGWERLEPDIRYSNLIVELRSHGINIVYPVIAKDVSIRAKAKRISGQNIFITLRKSDTGFYSTYFAGGRRFGIGKMVSGNKYVDLIVGDSPQSCDDFFDFEFSAVGDCADVVCEWPTAAGYPRFDPYGGHRTDRRIPWRRFIHGRCDVHSHQAVAGGRQPQADAKAQRRERGVRGSCRGVAKEGRPTQSFGCGFNRRRSFPAENRLWRVVPAVPIAGPIGRMGQMGRPNPLFQSYPRNARLRRQHCLSGHRQRCKRPRQGEESFGPRIHVALRMSDNGFYSTYFAGGRRFGIGKSVSGKFIGLIDGDSPQSRNDFFDFQFSAVGDTLTLSVDGKPLLVTHDSTLTAGTVGIGATLGSGLFTDVAMFIPTKESLVADNRKPPAKSDGDNSTASDPAVASPPVVTSDDGPVISDADRAGVDHLRRILMGYKWKYADRGYPSSIVQFHPNGKFHDQFHWNYWVVRPQTMHIQFWNKNYDPRNALVATFNDDLTVFTAAFPGHKITGTRLEPITTNQPSGK